MLAEKNIVELHKGVFKFLMQKHQENPELCFTLRKTNEQGRLSKGYWFWGNEDSLYFSFWHGIDSKTQTPNISITIDSHGKMLIFINARDSEKKAIFFEECINGMGRFTQYKNKNGLLENQWRRNYSREDWQDALTNFINEDKPIIDGLLKSYDADGFKPIQYDEFLKNAKVTNIFLPKFGLPIIQQNTDLQNNSSNQGFVTPTVKKVPEGKPLKLKSVHLKKIGHFEDINLDLSRQVSILIGENGSGKSTILKAIALALAGNADPDVLQNYLKIKAVDDRGYPIYEEKGEITISYEINNLQSVEMVFEKTEAKGVIMENYLHNEDDWLLQSNNRFYDLILGFPQSSHRNSENPESIAEPHTNDIIHLIEDRHIHKVLDDLQEWIYNVYIDKRESNDKDREIIETLFKIFSKVISGGENEKEIWVKEVFLLQGNQKVVVVCTPEIKEGIYLHLLSSGLQNVFFWVGRLVKRLHESMAFRNENHRNFLLESNNEGKRYEANTIFDLHSVVLIDEIDLYLHPKWQRNILKVLVESFPNIQFVVTSHSAVILSYFGNELNNFDAKVFLIKNAKIEADIEHFYGYRVSDILNNIQDTEEIPSTVKDAIIEMFAQIRFKDSKAIDTFEKLKFLLGKEHYAIRQAQKLIQPINS